MRAYSAKELPSAFATVIVPFEAPTSRCLYMTWSGTLAYSENYRETLLSSRPVALTSDKAAVKVYGGVAIACTSTA